MASIIVELSGVEDRQRGRVARSSAMWPTVSSAHAGRGDVGAGVRGRQRAVDRPADGLWFRSRRPMGTVQLPVYADVTAPADAGRGCDSADRARRRDHGRRRRDANGRVRCEVPRASERPLDSVEKTHRHGSPASDPSGRRRVRGPGASAGAGEARRRDHGHVAERRHSRAHDGPRLQDGARGDLVQVESLESKEQYDARVVGPREAAVFAQVAAGDAGSRRASRTQPDVRIVSLTTTARRARRA